MKRQAPFESSKEIERKQVDNKKVTAHNRVTITKDIRTLDDWKEKGKDNNNHER